MATNENGFSHHPSQSDIKEDGVLCDRTDHKNCDDDDAIPNEIESLGEALEDTKNELKRTRDELQRVQAEKEAEHLKFVNIENKLKQFEENREKQSAALIETGRELQAALSERESLMEQEDRIRAMVEEAQKAFELCKAADTMEDTEVTELEDDNASLSETAIIFKAKLQEMKNKLRESVKQQSFLEEENSFLRDELKSARDTVNSMPRLQNELATAQSVSMEREEKCASLQAQLGRAEFTVQEVKLKILSLQDKLIEEQETAARHCNEAEQLRITYSKQLQQIEKLQKVEKETKEKLDFVTKQLDKAEKERTELEIKIKELEERLIADEPSLKENKFDKYSERESVHLKKKKISMFLILGVVVCFLAVLYSQYYADRISTPM